MRRYIKLLLEWPLALALLLLAAPLMFAIALLIRVTDGPPVFYREQRVGRNEKCFCLIKFRTLRGAGGASIAPAGDCRIFPAAAALRRWRLDELPQLLNVLSGDMALVGPRPLSPRHADTLRRETRARLCSVRPGITGPSALAFLGDDVALQGIDNAEGRYLAELLPAKAAMDVDYVDHWSLLADGALLLKTLTQIGSRRARTESRDHVAKLLAAVVEDDSIGKN